MTSNEKLLRSSNSAHWNRQLSWVVHYALDVESDQDFVSKSL